MSTLKVLNVKIEGMHCGSCINHLDNVLRPKGAKNVDINLGRKFARITFEGEDRVADTFIETIEKAGYTPTKLGVFDWEE